MPDDVKPDDLLTLWHQSGVNPKGEPFVQLLLGDKVIAQLDMELAREHGHAMLEAAEAAEQDAFILGFFQQLGCSIEEAFAVLVDFRKQRAERTNKRGGPTNPRDWVWPSAPPGGPHA
jgi:hypothetical protein